MSISSSFFIQIGALFILFLYLLQAFRNQTGLSCRNLPTNSFNTFLELIQHFVDIILLLLLLNTFFLINNLILGDNLALLGLTIFKDGLDLY